MPLVRLPIAGPLETRDGTLTQDEVRTNVYIEPLDNQTAVVKRPGTRLCAYVAPGSCGRGAIFWNGRIRAMFGADIFSQNDCHVGSLVTGGSNALVAGPASLSGSGIVTPSGLVCTEAQAYYQPRNDIEQALEYNPARDEVWSILSANETHDARMLVMNSDGTQDSVIEYVGFSGGPFLNPARYDPSGPFMFVRRGNSIYKFNANTNAELANATPSPTGSSNLHVMQYGNDLYTSGSGRLNKVNKTTLVYDQSHTLLASSVVNFPSVENDANGLIWLTVNATTPFTGERKKLYTFDGTTLTLRYTYGGTGDLKQLAWDSNRSRMAVSTTDNPAKLLIFDLTFNLVATYTLPYTTAGEIKTLRYDALRDCYWHSGLNHVVIVRAGTGATFRDYAFTNASTTGIVPTDICLDGACNGYVIATNEIGTKRIAKLTVPLS